jgi:hypothetical protein
MARVIAVLIVLLLAAPAILAQEASSKQEDPPDFSNQTLLSIIHEKSDKDGPRDPFDIGITFERGKFRFHWVPFMAPLLVSTAAGYRVSPMAQPDPFTLMGTQFPYTEKTYRDRWRDWRLRRKLGI